MDNKEWEIVIAQIWDSKDLKTILKSVPTTWRDDFKSHLFKILIEMDRGKFIKIWKSGKIYYYIFGIVKNQWDNRKVGSGSSFWKENRILDDGETINSDTLSDDNEVSTIIILEDWWHEAKGDILDDFRRVNKNTINYFFNRQMFELYYFKGMKLKQISKETGINYEVVRKAIAFTRAFVEVELKKKLERINKL